MIEIAVTKDMLARAAALAVKLGTLRNSITSGKGNLAGFVGEIAVAAYTGATLDHDYDHDLRLGPSRIDVKTKRTTVVPSPHHECSVADFNTTQRCDLYAFARVKEDLSVAWVLGCLPKDVFYRDARFLRKGQIDGSNAFVVKADCYNVYIRDLLPLPPKEDLS